MASFSKKFDKWQARITWYDPEGGSLYHCYINVYRH